MNNLFHIQDDILISYYGREECVTVPSHVRTIGEGAFKACVSLKKIILPSGLCRILAGAFKGCRQLEEIVIPPGVTDIGDYAFHRCHHLREITLPASVKCLGSCAFLYCDSLTRIRMPGVCRLGKQAFVNDVLLQELEISPDLHEEDLRDVFTGCGKISSISFPDGSVFTFSNAVELVTGEMMVPPLVKAIALDILRMMELEGRQLVKFLTNLKHVEIPEGIESVKKSCFFDKRGILSVTLPASLKTLESRAFRNCIGLETVVFQNDHVEIQEDAFQNCTALKHIITSDKTTCTFSGISGLSGQKVPPLVQRIYRQVMSNFRISGTILLQYLGSESRVKIPEGITAIAEEAFAGNEAVDRIILPDSLQRIGAGAFRDCLVLQTIEFPEHIAFIGPGAFENCVKLIRALLPPGIRVIEPETFRHCHALRELSFGPSLQEIGEMAFYHCPSLKEVSFPESLKQVKTMAFYRCSGLKEIRLPRSVRHIGNLAFSESGVKKASLAGSGREFGTGIFSWCARLRTLILEPGVCHIPHKLAFGCGNLKKVWIPESLESVGRHALEQTPFLEEWTENRRQEFSALNSDTADIAAGSAPSDTASFAANIASSNTIGFAPGPGNSPAPIFLPPDGIFWDGRYLSGNVQLPEGIRIVAGGAFYGNDKVTRVQLPESVTWIGAAAFKGCRQLSVVTWPSGISTVEEEMFSGCEKLEAVISRYTTAAAFSVIGDRAFRWCSNLRKLDLHLTEKAGKEAFFGCASLEKNPVPNLLFAGESAFEGTRFPDTSSAAPGLSLLGHILLSGRESAGEICLPRGIRGIAPYAFSGNRHITKVIFPDTLTWIGEGAFWGCSGLEQAEFSHTPCQIGEGAFEKCTHLKKVRLYSPDTGKNAFAFCTSLIRAELYGLPVLEKGLFEGCASLKTCVCPRTEEIKPSCFSGCRDLKSLEFGRLRRIGSYGFQDCDHLQSVDLRDHTLLMPHAFEDCGRLKQVRLTGEGAIDLREYAFSGCTALETVTCGKADWHRKHYGDLLSETIPQIVRLIFASALSCFLVEKESILSGYRGQGRIVHIPEGIRRIAPEVFRDILMLEEVEIPGTVEEIGARAFHRTAWLENQRRRQPLVTVNHMVLDGSCCFGEVVVPENVRHVCGWAFAGGLDIRKIRFLSDRTRVGEYAFRNCINLQEMILADNTVIRFGGIEDRQRELPAIAKQAVMDRLNCFKTDENQVLVECTGNIPRLSVAEGITAIGDRAFQDGNLLTILRLPSTVTSIGTCAFASCKWLTRLEQGIGVERVGEMAFSGCGRLEQVELSEKLKTIGMRAFENCTSLKEILIPEGVEEIPERAFFRCHSLEQVTLPSTLKRIGKEAFAFCRNLRPPLVQKRVEIGDRAFTGILVNRKEQEKS